MAAKLIELGILTKPASEPTPEPEPVQEVPAPEPVIEPEPESPIDHGDLYLHTMQDYNDAIKATKGGKPLVIDFTAGWCPPCKRIGPIYEGHINNYPEITMRKLDVDQNDEACADALIRCMPTFKVYKNG